MNTDILNPKGIVFLLVSILIVTWGTQSISYAQEADPTLTVSVEEPLTEANLNGSTVTLTLSSGRFVDQMWHIEAALSISGIDGVTIGSWFYFQRVSATEVIIPLTFSGNIDTDVTLTFTVGALAIPGYNGSALTATLPVTAIQESLEASTESPLTDLTLHRSVVTLTLSGRIYEQSIFSIEDAVMVSGIEGVTFDGFFDLDRISDTEVTVELKFSGNIDTDATLTFTVGAGAIAGYDGSALTATLPVTTIEEPLVASTEFLLTEANLDGSTITLTLTGVRFVDDEDDIGRGHTVSVSGIEGVYIKGGWFSADVSRMSDTEVTVELGFDGTDFDTDATLTFTVGANAIDGISAIDVIRGYHQNLTAQIPVTAIYQSNATVSISPASIVSPNVGEQLTFDLNIEGGENVAGYQATVVCDDTALDSVDFTNGDYLPADAFFLADSYRRYGENYSVRVVKLTATTLAGAANGDGTLATLTFEVVDFKPSTVTLSEVYLVDADGKQWEVTTEKAKVTIPPEPEKALFGDINRDGVVNIQDLVIVNARYGEWGHNSADLNGDGLVDIVDIVLVASAFGAEAAAPVLNPQVLTRFTTGDVQGWLSQARQLTLTDPAHLRGITVLEQLLKALTPKKTMLLPNYPNPFNPETWIPYHLSDDADVQVSIYDTKGVLVRRLDLGHQMAGYYTVRAKAAYWDGKNKFGEQAASGLYFYHLSAGDYSATRKMLILK